MKKLDRFIFQEIISDGPAGTIYKADESLPGDNLRTVALKVLPSIDSGDAAALNRFYSEVNILAQLTVQPHVVTIYSMGMTDGNPWLAMEYAEATAERRIGEEPADPAEVMRLIEQVSRGLLAMHSLKPPLIHQDIKPANILLDASGNYKVTDFSLATAVAANRTHGMATVRYAAPELLSAEFGKVGPPTDLYSLGHVAYEMALGNRLHRQQFKAVFEGNANREPPPNKWMMWHASGNTKPVSVGEVRNNFPIPLSDIIARLMAKSVAQRYTWAQEVLNDIAAIKEQDRAHATQASTAVAPPPIQTSSIPPDPTAPVAATTPASETPAEAPIPRAAPVKSVPTVASNTRYWVRLRGRVTGPYDTGTLQRQIRQGQISRLHQVSADQVTWKSAAEIDGLTGPTVV